MYPITNSIPAARALLSLQGLCLGDAFGQQFFASEDLISNWLKTRTPPPGPWHYTDDTLMAASVYDVLRRFGTIDQDALAASFAQAYDFQRGYGPSMHRLLLKFQQGEDWRVAAAEQFGGMGSIGNGSAMRVAPIGAYFFDDLDRVIEEAARSSVVTHTHADAVAGAIAVAAAAAMACRTGQDRAAVTPRSFLESVIEHVPGGTVKNGLIRAIELPDTASVRLAVSALGNGVGLTAADTVPLALWVASRHLFEFEDAMWNAVSALGDRDTICAIVGGVVVLSAGEKSVPKEWLEAREPLPAWIHPGPESERRPGTAR